MIKTSEIEFSYSNELSFRFPRIELEQGETLLITGKSGKGKSTFLHLLSGILRPTSGTIQIGNTDITKLTEYQLDKFRGKNIGLVLQKSYFLESFSVLENLNMVSWLATGKHSDKQSIELLRHLDIEEQMHKSPAQLSVGEQQRVSIALALINHPKLILADEPTSSLDDENTLSVKNLLSTLPSSYGTSLIIVTHDSRLKQHLKNQLEL